MKYLSVFSGIEAATVAWHPLGMEPIGFSEIDPFPCAVLKHHYPDIKNYGDITRYKEWSIETNSIQLLVGGSPCQSFSLAGLRKGLADPRGNLALVFLGLADHLKPKWILWENVPGVLSSGGGRDFGTFLGALGLLGYGFAYRVLDAQHFGVPQRRRRVFLVGHLGDWRPAAAVLFEREGLRGDPPAGRKKRKDLAPTLAARTKGGGGLGTDFDLDGGLNMSPPSDWQGPGFIHPRQLRNSQSSNQLGIKPDAEISDALTSEGPGAVFQAARGSGRGYWMPDTVSGTIDANMGQSGHSHRPAVIFDSKQDGGDASEVSHTLRAMGHHSSHANAGGQFAALTHGRVRRLTARECERLQGFPDDYSRIPWRGKKAEDCPDGPRYKALGNSFAVPVVRWIGERLLAYMKERGNP
jgi:DNA (cytosine-5)-methyltransferase 1